MLLFSAAFLTAFTLYAEHGVRNGTQPVNRDLFPAAQTNAVSAVLQPC
jgi:hypothetical protein